MAAFIYFQASQILMSSNMGIVLSLALVAGEESHAVPSSRLLGVVRQATLVFV